MMDTQPVVTTAWFTSLGAAVLALLFAFGVPIDDDQKAAILTVLSIVGPLVAGYVARRWAYAPATARARYWDGYRDRDAHGRTAARE